MKTAWEEWGCSKHEAMLMLYSCAGSTPLLSATAKGKVLRVMLEEAIPDLTNDDVAWLYGYMDGVRPDLISKKLVPRAELDIVRDRA